MMQQIRNKEYGGERPLFATHDIQLEDVTIHAGESALKECSNIIAINCRFEGKYPFWHTNGFIVISAVVVVAVFVGLALFKGCTTSQAKDVEVPNFVGKTIAEANADNKENFNFVIESKYDASKELGVILEQEPAADSKLVKSGSPVTSNTTALPARSGLFGYESGNVRFKSF